MPEEPMTPDPLELTHRAYAALNSRDLDAFVGLLARSCVYDLSRFDLGTYAGPEAIRRFYEEWVQPLYEFGVVVDEIKNLGSGVIYAVQRGHRSRSPGFSLALGGGVVGVWEHGKLARMTVYPDSDEALAAAERLAQERGSAVSAKNVELVRHALDAVIRRDYREASDCFHADAIWHNTRGFPGPLTCVGPRAIIEFWTTLVEGFSVRDPALGAVRDDADRSGTNIEHVASDHQLVVVGLHSVAWGRQSGAPLDLRWGAIFSVNKGKISRVDVHGDWKKALRAAGLEP